MKSGRLLSQARPGRGRVTSSAERQRVFQSTLAAGVRRISSPETPTKARVKAVDAMTQVVAGPTGPNHHSGIALPSQRGLMIGHLRQRIAEGW